MSTLLRNNPPALTVTSWRSALLGQVRSKTGQVLLLGVISGLSLVTYLAFSAALFRVGFPLDDAWIHQTYARNLAGSGQLAFIPGQVSAGSTSPAWTGLLAIGYVLQVQHLAWAYFLGWVLLWGGAVISWIGFEVLGITRRAWIFAAGALFALEWHLVWAAGSGMETLLQADLILLVLVSLLSLEQAERKKLPVARAPWPWMLVGLVAGFSVWVRPDGLSLLGLAGWVILCGAWPAGGKIRLGLVFAAGFSILFLPYLWFNLHLTGEVWPNTFYAKQAEYAILRTAPLWQRLLAEFRLPLVGIGILLLPGLALFSLDCFQKRQLPALGGVLWLIGYLGLYASRLPVTYQHGRYVIPAMPVFFLYGLAGLAIWFDAVQENPQNRLLQRAWLLACCAVLTCFWLLGARSFALDVAVIESEMVETARWLAQNSEPGARIAAHDIGALGYYGRYQILDLAGLVSPEVIPILRDEHALAAFLDRNRVDYLVTFPGWYPHLVRLGSEYFTTHGEFSPGIGGENMTVYRWNPLEGRK